MPIDKATIATHLILKEVLGTTGRNDLDSLPAEIRRYVHDIRVMKARHSFANGSLETPIEVIVDPKWGIRLSCTKTESGLVLLEAITINPGRILFGQNGSIITEKEFGKALSFLVVQVKPLLDNPDDWDQLIPGLSEASYTNWESVEITFQFHDPDLKYLKLYECSKHREIRKSPHFRSSDESITFQNSTGELAICAYRKDLEARNRQKLNLRPGTEPTTRVEVRLSGKKLHQHMSSAVWRQNGKQNRLIQFCADDLVAAWMSVISGFSGVSQPGGQQGDSLKFSWARFAGFLSVKFDIEWSALLSAVMEMKGPMPQKKLNQFIKRISDPAQAEISRLVKLSIHEVATPEAWFSQPDVIDDEVLESCAKRLNSLPVRPDFDLTDGLYS